MVAVTGIVRHSVAFRAGIYRNRPFRWVVLPILIVLAALKTAALIVDPRRDTWPKLVFGLVMAFAMTNALVIVVRGQSVPLIISHALRLRRQRSPRGGVT